MFWLSKNIRPLNLKLYIVENHTASFKSWNVKVQDYVNFELSPNDMFSNAVNSEIFVRVLFSRNCIFREN